MTEKPTEMETVYLEWDVWSDMLREFKCPECGKKVTRVSHPTMEGREKLACNNCNTYLEPPEREKVERKTPTIRERETAAERSGGSLYPPLQIHFFCDRCLEYEMAILEEKNKFEREGDLPLTTPTGMEGLTKALILSQSLIKQTSNHLPFDCKCGSRYYLEIEIGMRNKKHHPLFGIELGFHSNCVNCRLGFDKAVGKKHFQMRCDLNLRCPLITDYKKKFFAVDESGTN